MNNGFENDNVNENDQPGIENGNINSDTNVADTTTEADAPRSADSTPARSSNGAGRQRPQAADPDTNAEPADTPKEKFSFKNFKISDMFAQIKKFWADMPSKKKKISIAAAVGTVALVVILAVAINSTRNPMVKIYTGLDRAEAMTMAGVLEELGMTAKVETSAGVVVLTVRQSQEYAAVMKLSDLGYPKKAGIVYTEQATGGLFVTEAEIEEATLTNRQNRLGAIIETIEGVEQANVTIVPESKTYAVIAKNTKPTTATAVIHMQPNFTMSHESIMGIETLILNSVEGLERAYITITDGSGKQINVAEDATQKFDTLSEFKKTYEREAEYNWEARLTELYERTYGPGNVSFSVAIEYDFNQWIRELVKYNGANIDPDTEEQKGILSSEEWERNIFSGTDSSVQGAAGTDLNMDDPNYYELSDQAAEGNFGDNYHRYNQYLVDSLQEQSSKETPIITSCTITMLVSKVIESDEEELLINSIATASPVVGLALKNATEDTVLDVDTYRSYISVLPLPFYEAPVEYETDTSFNLLEWLLENFTATQLLIGAGILLLFILLIIVVIIIVRRTSKKGALISAAEEEDRIIVDSEGKPFTVDDFGKAVGKYASEEAMPAPIKPNENKEQLLKKQIKMFTDQNPDITAQLIRTLIKGDEPTNG